MPVITAREYPPHPAIGSILVESGIGKEVFSQDFQSFNREACLQSFFFAVKPELFELSTNYLDGS